MEEFIIQNLANLTSEAALIITWFAMILYGIPHTVKYLREESQKNRDELNKLIADAREEREAFYRQLGIINDKLEVINDNITGIHHEINDLKSK